MPLVDRSGFAKTHVETRITAQVTRADGTVEPPKVVAYWHRNPLRRLLFKLTKKVV